MLVLDGLVDLHRTVKLHFSLALQQQRRKREKKKRENRNGKMRRGQNGRVGGATNAGFEVVGPTRWATQHGTCRARGVVPGPNGRGRRPAERLTGGSTRSLIFFYFSNLANCLYLLIL